MKKVFSIFISALVIGAFLVSGISFAEEEEERRPLSELTAGELYEKIKDMLELEDEILEYIPEIKAVFDKAGKAIKIEYRLNGVLRDLKDMSKETLLKILSRVNNERIRIQTERLTRQLETIRRAREAANIPRVPSQPPEAPRVTTPPQAPPAPPAAPPAPPSLPPDSSTRR